MFELQVWDHADHVSGPKVWRKQRGYKDRRLAMQEFCNIVGDGVYGVDNEYRLFNTLRGTCVAANTARGFEVGE